MSLCFSYFEILIFGMHRVEQAYIDAYEGEGWKGANREKLRSDNDLKQAHLQVS